MPTREWYERVLSDNTAMTKVQVWHKWREKIYAYFLEKNVLGKTLLDVGCGDGELLRRAREKGYRVTGIDFNRIVISKAKKKFGLEVYTMDLNKFSKKFPKKFFDVISFFEVMEHQDEPGDFLNLVKNTLNPEGYIVLSVPNRERFKKGKRHFPEWDSPPHHFTWWDRSALENFLRLRGFEIVDFKEFKRFLKKDGREVNGPYLYVLAKLKK